MSLNMYRITKLKLAAPKLVVVPLLRVENCFSEKKLCFLTTPLLLIGAAYLVSFWLKVISEQKRIINGRMENPLFLLQLCIHGQIRLCKDVLLFYSKYWLIFERFMNYFVKQLSHLFMFVNANIFHDEQINSTHTYQDQLLGNISGLTT